jgi:iron complex outermembrane receptor protein
VTQERVALLGCVLFCQCAAFAPAHAQELSEREFLTEFPTVLTATRLRQDVTQTPGAITVVDQDMIRASGVRQISELFRLIPGFNVSYVTYVKGLQPLVNYHGLDREFFSRLQVLVDGRSLNNVSLGGIDWNDFPLALDEIDRIEVIRGPSNATYGIGAFAATINFISKHPAQERGLRLSGNVGSNSIVDGATRYASGVGSLDYRASLGYRSDGGFPDLRDSLERTFGSLDAAWQIDARSNLTMHVGGTDGHSDVGSGAIDDPFRKARVTTAYAQARWERNVDADNGIALQFYYYQHKVDDLFRTDPIPLLNNARLQLDEGSTASRYDLQVQQTFSLGPRLLCVWGASAREDAAEAPLILRGNERLHLQQLFGHVQWGWIDNVLVNVGAMVEHNNLTGTDVAPQLALNLRLAPSHVVRMRVAKGLRTPTLFEQKVPSVIVGPPGDIVVTSGGALQPETIWSREVSYLGEVPAWRTTLDVKAFYDTLSNLIDLVGDPTSLPGQFFPRTIVNGDDVRQWGVEGQLNSRPTPTTSLMLAATHLDISSADRFGAYSRSAPRDSVHALVSQRFANAVDGSIVVHYQSGYRANGLSDPQGSFTRVDLRLAKGYRFAQASGEIAVTVQNVFDRHYTEFRRDNLGERQAWLSLSLQL